MLDNIELLIKNNSLVGYNVICDERLDNNNLTFEILNTNDTRVAKLDNLSFDRTINLTSISGIVDYSVTETIDEDYIDDDVLLYNAKSLSYLDGKLKNILNKVSTELPFSSNGIYFVLRGIYLGTSLHYYLEEDIEDSDLLEEAKKYEHLFDTDSEGEFLVLDACFVSDVAKNTYKDYLTNNLDIYNTLYNTYRFDDEESISVEDIDFSNRYIRIFINDLAKRSGSMYPILNDLNIPIIIDKEGLAVETLYDIDFDGLYCNIPFKFKTNLSLYTMLDKINYFGTMPYYTSGNLYNLLSKGEDGVYTDAHYRGFMGCIYTYTDLISQILDLTKDSKLFWINSTIDNHIN